MKKFTFILMAITISSFVFAQFAKFDMSKVQTSLQQENFENDAKSAWFGGGFTSWWTGSNVGDQFFIVGSEFPEAVVGDQITKVKFYHKLGLQEFQGGTSSNFTNTQYTIRIYENPTLAGANADIGFYDTPIGTAVYSESVTLGETESGTIYEHTLGTPYTITTDVFFVSVSFDNGLGAMRLGAADPANITKYYMYYTDEGTTYCATTDFGGDILSLGIGLYVDDGGAYVEQSDLETWFIDNGTAQNTITELTIGLTDDLSLNPIIWNHGPDNADQVITIAYTAGGNNVLTEEFDPVTDYPAGFIEPSGGIYYPMNIMTAAEMDAAGLTGTFDVCITLTYAGTDPVTTNNTSCIAITRGEVVVTECDLEMIFMTSNTDFTPIPSTLAITATDGITVFPGVKNNGPDDANTTATIDFTINGLPASESQTIPMTGLVNGATSPLTPAGQLITAANMDAMGLTGTFDVCMTVTYNGTDNNADNNTTCVTVTRDPVNVDINIAKAISIYPNPANSIITVANAENENIVVLNMLGEVVANISNATSNQTIDISNLSNGTYFVRVNSEVFKINVIK